ncbi:MAG: sodium:solute symporter [Bacteroidota bacterium]
MNNLASPGMLFAVWISLAIYAAVILFFVIRGARRTKTMADYASGTFQFSPAAIGLSLAAGMTSAATFIINPGFVAYYGISSFLSMAVFLPLGALISLVILSKKFRKIGNSNTVQAKTIAQWLGTRFQSDGFRLYIAFLSLLHLTFIVLICVGLTQVLSKALNADVLYVLIGLVVFTFGYMMFGGANSMVYTNMIQALLKVVVAIVILVSGYHFFSGEGGGLFSKLNAIDPQLTKPFNASSPLYRDFFEVVICQFIVGVAIVCQPHIITRSMLLKSDKDMNRFLTVAVILLILFFTVVFAGLYGRLSFPGLTFNGAPLPLDGVMSAYVVSSFKPAMSLFLVVGLIASGIATLESLIQSISTTITSDIIRPLSRKSELKNGLMINRLVIGLMAAITILVSYRQLVHPDLSVGILAQNGVYASFSAAFVPLLFGMFLKDVHKSAAITASVVAIVVHFAVYYGRLTTYMQNPVRNPGVASAIAIMSSLVIGGIVYVITKRKMAVAVA